MPNEAEEKIESELASQERLLWSGIPQQGLMFRRTDALLIPFSLMWGGFAIFWEIGVTRSNAPVLFDLWGIPFVLFGLYFIFGRFVVDRWQRAHTWYGVTDLRVIILTQWISRSIKSVSLRGLDEMSLDVRSDRRGTIVFGPTPAYYPRGSTRGWPGMGMRTQPMFEGIEEARTVHELIREAQGRASDRATAQRSGPTGVSDLDSRRG